MLQKTEVEMERARIIKISRVLMRLKYSLLADKELNETLPRTLQEFDKGIQNGELLSLPDSILKDLLES